MKETRTDMQGASRRDELLSRAREIRSRFRRVSRVRRAADAFVFVGALLLFLGAIDAMWPAPGWLRVMFAAALYAGIGFAAWRSLIPTRDARLSEAEAVGRAEQRSLGEEGVARSAVEMIAAPASADGVTRALVDRVIAQGIARLRSLELGDVVDASPMRRALVRLGFVIVAFAALVVAAPRVVGTEALRLFDPLGDHPAYSSLRVTVEVTPREVRVGDDVRVDVVVRGGAPSEAILEVRRTDGASERLAMAAARGDADTSHAFSVTLRDLRDPVRLRAHAGGAATRWLDVTPTARPRLRGATLTIQAPAYAMAEDRVFHPPLDDAPVALVGSMARIDALTSMEIAELVATDADDGATEDRRAWALWRLGAAGSVTVSLDALSAAGLGLDEPVSAVVEVVEDAPPVIDVRSPRFGGGERNRAPAAPTGVIVIDARARDDVRLEAFRAEWRLIRKGTDEGEWRDLAIRSISSGGAWRMHGGVSLPDLEAQIGDRIELRFLARDGRSAEFGGAQETVTGPMHIDVISPEAYGALAPGGDGETVPAPSEAGEGVASPTDGASAPDGSSADDAGKSEVSEVGTNESEGVGGGAGGSAGDDGGVSRGEPDSDGSSGADGDGGAPVGPGGAADSSLVTEERRGAPGDLRALGWGGGVAGAAPLLDPVVLNRLPRRARDLISRYYELMATQEVR